MPKEDDAAREVPEDLGFEAALERLEEIVAELESGELGLEEGLKQFELAMRLREYCSRKLREAEARIEEYAAKAEATGQAEAAPGPGPQTLFDDSAAEEEEEEPEDDDILGNL